MFKRILLRLSLFGILTLPVSVLADAQIHEWYGEYAMNHDGWRGTLVISDSKADCASSPWCAMVLKYRDHQGQTHRVAVEKIDNKGQHMVFYIYFPQNKQKFDAYLFSWDKSKMAGTTYWGGRTFGFYATKRQ